MDLTTGSAFVRFYGIPIVGQIQFELHRTTPAYTPKIALDETSKIINITDKSGKEISQILEFLRAKRKHAIVIDEDGTITDKFAQNVDIIINPINGNYSWDIEGEFKEKKMALVELLISQNELTSSDKEHLFKNPSSKNEKAIKNLFQII